MSAAEKIYRDSDRITRMRLRFQTEKPVISIERARYFTEAWRKTESLASSPGVRFATAMKNVFEKMTHTIQHDDHLAGAWTEYALGWPIDIERGLFNNVLAVELSKKKLFAYQVKSYLKFFAYLLKKKGLRGIYRTMRESAELGPTPVSIGLDTLLDRKINAFAIDPADNEMMQRDLLPYWRGKTMADFVATELRQSGIMNGSMSQFLDNVPNTPSQQILVPSVGASIATYQGHMVMDHEMVLRRGLVAIKQDVQDALSTLSEDKSDEHDFLQSVIIALEGMIVYAQRLADAVERAMNEASDPERKNRLEKMLEVCRKVPLHPAETFHEAVQSIWTHRVTLEIAHPANVHAYGRLDQILLPYYRNDQQNGCANVEEARELLAELLLKVMTQNVRPESNFLGNFYLRYEGSTPITLSGITPEGHDATNELTYLFLEAADLSKSVTSIVLRVHKDTPDELHQAVAGVLHEGTSNLSMMNDDVFVPAMEKYGFSPTDARDYAITGCTDLVAPGKTGGISFSGLLLGRVLDAALRNGQAQTLLGTISEAGPQTGDPESLVTFDDFFDAVMLQADHQIKLNVEASNLRDRLFAEQMPAPFLSAFIQGCLENRKDITRGGATYNYSGINVINSVANLIDSLYVIKELIYEQRRFSFKELLMAIDANFVGHENLHRAIAEVNDKWGNGAPKSDAMARRVTDSLFALMGKYHAYKDGPFVPFMNSMTSHTIDGRLSIATPDGRRAATPYAASCNPYNVDRCGVTGVLRSVTAIDFTNILGCAVNVRLHPSAIGESRSARQKWISLVRTYFNLGGAQLQPTVASAQMLRDAQQDPESYRHLIVKVGGYSTYFVDLGKEIQNEIISRTEHGSVN